MKSKRSRAIIKALYKEVDSYRIERVNLQGKKTVFFFIEDKNKIDRLLYKIKYQKSLLAAKKMGF